MKSIRTLASVAVVGLAATLVTPVSASPAAKSVSFKASFSGTASVLIDNSNVTIQSVTGTGKASLLGTSTVTGKGNGTGANGQCVPFTGKGLMKSSAGSIKFTVVSAKSQGCSSGQSGPVTVTVNGQAKVSGGTGKTSGAKGTLKFKGTLNLKDTTGSQSGEFSGTLSGKLTVK